VTAWYLTDHEGSVRDIVDTSGTVLDHIAYDSYGNVTSESSPSNGDRFKFDGMAMDAAIGLYYDNARYYDSASGRFVSQDPTGFTSGDENLFRFTHNSPSNQTDVTGLRGDPDDGYVVYGGLTYYRDSNGKWHRVGFVGGGYGNIGGTGISPYITVYGSTMGMYMTATVKGSEDKVGEPEKPPGNPNPTPGNPNRPSPPNTSPDNDEKYKEIIKSLEEMKRRPGGGRYPFRP
jgi:RHS repeat-associated protein